jgi:lipoic acid synthetase
VEEYVTPDKFSEWQTIAEGMGFLYVASGPLVRSSYRAGEFFMKGIIEKQRANELNQKSYKMTTQEGKELSQNGN